MVVLVFQWTQFTGIHTILAPSPRTEMIDSMELELGDIITAMARELPLIEILVYSSLGCHMAC